VKKDDTLWSEFALPGGHIGQREGNGG